MTEREEAQRKATESLNRASLLRDRAIRIANAWRQSQEDNNFRQMLRDLGGRATGNESR